MHAYRKSSENEDAQIAALQTEIDHLQEALGNSDAEAVVKGHIKLLHDYNEAKDATQIVLGRLAVIKETTVKQLHEDYGLTKDD